MRFGEASCLGKGTGAVPRKPVMPDHDKLFCFRLDEETRAMLADLSVKRRVSKAQVVRELVRDRWALEQGQEKAKLPW